jgi:N-acetylmuramoyl-L-alanine amidase
VRPAVITALLFAWILPSRADWNVVMRDKRRYVSLQDVATFYKMNPPVTDGKKFRLTAPGRSIEGQANGRDVLINGVKYVLCFSIVSEGGRHLISAMDVVKIIEPILRPQKIKNASAVRTVILDAGHGGHDSGARGPLGTEKDAALDVVLRTRKLLLENGYRVQCTRLTDSFIPLEKRAEFANKHTNAIFVAVHFNKSNTGGGTGLETYCLAPRGVPSMDEENLRYSDFVQYPGHAHDPENVALATCVHASLVRTLGLTDRGIKRARFVVIKNLKIPGILVEGGFMSGAPDYQLIATPAYRQRMAQSIVDGVNRYKNAITGQIQYQKPSAIVSATDPTTVPNLDKPIATTPAAPIGSKTDSEAAVAQAQEALKATTKGN